MNIKLNYIKSLIIFLPALAFMGSLVQQVYYIYRDVLYLWIGWIGNVLVVISAFIIQRVFRENDLLDRTLITTDIISENQIDLVNPLKPRRYLTILPYAMVVGTLASVAIHSWFIVGMVIYLIMHALLIYSYSGIIRLKIRFLFSAPIRRWSIIIIGAWLATLIIIFSLLILPGLEGLMIYIVLLYVIFLITMATVTFLHLPYRLRKRGFRFTLALGATSFVFSDTVIGYAAFTNPFRYSSVLAQPTYMLATALITVAIVFQLPKK